MSSTPKNHAALYLALMITGIVLGLTVPSAVAQNPSRGKHNGKIVFISNRNYKGLSVWSMNPDGSSPTRLTDDTSRGKKLPDFSPVYDSHPVWSPDGTKIAFISNRDYHFALYVMNADGSNARLVTDKVIDSGEPAWSPDGGKIAFSGGARGSIGSNMPSVNIYVVNVDGRELTQLTRDAGMNGNPNWSPDGKQIVFSSTRDDSFPRWKIWIMNADGSNQRVLPNPQNTTGTGFKGGEPIWSPDGTKILFIGQGTCGKAAPTGIYLVDVDNGNSRLLTNDKKNCGRYDSPRWSPDGTKILAGFTPDQEGILEPAPQIVVMNGDGTNQINISNRGKYGFISGQSRFTDFHADWQPLPAPSDFKSSVIGFSEASYTAYNDVDNVPITVTRTGNLDDVAACFYATFGDPNIVYYDAFGTLRFARGESTKTISIPNPLRKFNLKTSVTIFLSDNSGNATFIGGIKEAALTILPN